MSKTKNIVVIPYDPEWPKVFEQEALKIKEALGENCLAVYHVGSTSVPGLRAKPVIDMIGVFKNPEGAVEPLAKIGYKQKGEYNIPMRWYFNHEHVNLHAYEESHPEIELNLLFRDYLRAHPEARDEYGDLKEDLLKEKSSYEKNNSVFTGYNLGKDAFIRKILKLAGFTRVRMLKCTHYAEWDFVKALRQKYFFKDREDPYTWTFDHSEHAHLVLYRGVDMVGYAQIQFWPENRAAIRIFVIDEAFQHQGLGSEFLKLIEPWLRKLGVKTVHDESRPDSIDFYRKNGYTEMLFNDPSGEPPSPYDIAVGKKL